jgi:hypothetical protein
MTVPMRRPHHQAPGEDQMVLRVSPAGIVVGALVGGVGRATVAALHMQEISRGLVVPLLIAALVGMIVGGLAGATGRPLLGAVAGAVLSGLATLALLPAVAFLYLLGAVTLPSLLESLVVGGLAGGIGGLAGQMASARRSTLDPRATRSRSE